MASIVKKTTDYDMFKKHENNRKLDHNNIKKLTYSITLQNMLEFRPMLVDSDMRVIDGQHRLEVAKNLGLEIYYQVNEEATTEDIVLLNNFQRHWRNENFIEHWASLGNENYKRLIEYAKKKGMEIHEVYTLLRGTFGLKTEKIRSGKFQFFNKDVEKEVDAQIERSQKVLDVIKRYTIQFPRVSTSYRLKQAIFAMLQNPQVDLDMFIAKITYKADSLRPCTSMVGYFSMLRDIYNWRNSAPID